MSTYDLSARPSLRLRERARAAASSRWLPPLVLGAIVALGTAAIAYYGLRVHGVVLYDEKFTVQGARYYHENLGALLDVDGVARRGLERLTAVLLLPVVALFSDAPQQLAAGHVWLAFLAALTAVPIFLIGRGLRLSVGWAAVGAALSVLTPWAAFGLTFLNNATAATLSAWALWAAWRATLRPGLGIDALAIGFYILAALSRISLIGLIAAWPVAIAVQMWRDREPGEGLGTFLKRAPRRVWRDHPLLPILAVLVLALVAAKGKALVGVYPAPTDFPLIDIWDRLLRLAWHVGAAMAIVPPIVALGWLAHTLVRPSDREIGTFAVLATATIFWLLYVNHAGGHDERYELVGAAPVAAAFAVAMGRRQVRLWPTLAASLLVIYPMTRWGWSVSFIDAKIDYLLSPAGLWSSRVWAGNLSLHIPLGRQALLLGLCLIGTGAAVACAVVRGRAGDRVRGLVAAGVVLISAVGSIWAMDKLSEQFRPGISFRQAAFIDTISRGADVRPLANPEEYDGAVVNTWDEMRYFNTSVRGVLSLNAHGYELCCVANGAPQVGRIDNRTGSIRIPGRAPAYVLTEPQWIPYGVATHPVFTSAVFTPPVRVEKVVQPLRATWLAWGMTKDGTVRRGRFGRLATFPRNRPGGGPSCLRLTVIAPSLPPGVKTRWQVGPMHGALQGYAQKTIEVPLPDKRRADLIVRGSASGLTMFQRQATVQLWDPQMIRCGQATIIPPRVAP